MRRLPWVMLLLGVVLSLLLSFRLATQSVIVGIPEGGWAYGYVGPFSLRIVLVFLLAAGVTAGLLAVSEVVWRRSEWLMIATWFVGAIVLQGLLCSLAPFDFQTIFAHDGANSFYSVARQFTPTAMLRDFDRVRLLWPQHAQSNMPGKAVFVHLLMAISARADVLPWLVVAVSNLGGVLMYFFVRDLLADRRAARYALALYAVVPGKIFFFPLLNTVTPVTTLLCAWLLIRWLRTGRPAYAAAFGASIYLMVLFEPLGLAIGLFFAACIGWALRSAVIEWKPFLWQSLVAIVGFAAVYDVVLAALGFDLWTAFRALTAEAQRFNVDAGRPYGVWVVQNLLDFIVGLGVCQAVLFAPAFVEGVKESVGRSRGSIAPIVVVVVGIGAVVASTDLIGVNRGEVVRLWIFLACFAQIPAAYLCARLESRAAVILVLATTLLHDAIGASMVGFIIAR